MPKLKPTKVNIAILGGAFAVVLLIVGFVLWLQSSALAAATRELGERRTQLDKDQRIAKRRELALQSLEADREELRFLEEGVSSAEYVPTLLNQLEDLAIETQNRVKGVRPQVTEQAPTRLQQRRDVDAKGSDAKKADTAEEKKKAEPYVRVPIQVNLIGNYVSVQAFTDRLQRFPKILAVESVQLRPYQQGRLGEGPEDLLDAELRVTAFILKAGQTRVADGEEKK